MDLENKPYTEESVTAICEKLKSSGKAAVIAENTDMMPLLHEDRDMITVVNPQGKLKKDDIVFYQSSDGQYKISRVVFINADTYVMCGDAVWINEYNVSDEQIVGVMKSFVRKGRKYSTDSKEYERYLKLLPAVRWIYRFYNSLRIRIINFIKYLTKK